MERAFYYLFCCLALAELAKEGKFVVTEKQDEEDEHSLELHLPYIAKIFEG